MKRRYFTIFIGVIKDLNTTNFDIEIPFSVSGEKPDFVELSVQSGEQPNNTTYDKFLVEMKDGLTDYECNLKMPLANTIFRVVASPVMVDSNNNRILTYEEGITVDIDERYVPYAVVRSPNENEQYPAPVITQIVPFPKRISSKSGGIINWQSKTNYSEYELLIRVTGEEAYDIISFNATVNNSYNLLSQKLNNVTIDFIMSDSNHLHNYEIQIRGVSPPSPFSTKYSKWSNVVRFHSATALNSLRTFFGVNNLNTSIRNYLPQNMNLSLRKQMWFDDIY